MTYQHFGVSRSVRISRDELGRPVSTRIGSESSIFKSFDGVGRLSSLETKNRNQDTVGSFEFEYDPNSNITVIDQMVDGVVTPKNYVHDAENRLTQAEHGASIESWNLDLLGNWLGNGKVYNTANQLTEDQDYFYSYDQRGNLIQKSAKLGGATTSFGWDYFNRLVEVEIATKRVSYKYDPTGRRTERTMEDLTSSTTKTSRWTYLNEDQWAEANELDQVLAVTLNGETIDDILSMTVKDQNQTTPGIALDPIKDHLGSVHGWTEASSGSVIQKQGYSAYGETTITNASGLLSQLGSQRGYTSRELDGDTGLYYYRARYYNPKTGRFLSEDPIGFDGGDLNWYRFVSNNPLINIDPTGLLSIQESELQGTILALSMQLIKLQQDLQKCVSVAEKSKIQSQIAKISGQLRYNNDLLSFTSSELNRLCPQGYWAGRNLTGRAPTRCELMMGAIALNNAKAFLDDGSY